MPLSPLPYREVRRRPEAAGFAEMGQRGSHVKFEREIGEGTLYSILRQAGLTPEKFERL